MQTRHVVCCCISFFLLVARKIWIPTVCISFEFSLPEMVPDTTTQAAWKDGTMSGRVAVCFYPVDMLRVSTDVYTAVIGIMLRTVTVGFYLVYYGSESTTTPYIIIIPHRHHTASIILNIYSYHPLASHQSQKSWLQMITTSLCLRQNSRTHSLPL